jgi:hypothetical protein
MTPWSQISRLHNYEAIDFCCLTHFVCGICYSSHNKLPLPSVHGMDAIHLSDRRWPFDKNECGR